MVEPLSRADEAAILLKAAAGLEAACGHGADRARWTAAVQHNLAVWRAIRDDVASPDQGQPAALRRRIAELADFVERHSSLALVSADAALLRPLIQIDTHIARGLLD